MKKAIAAGAFIVFCQVAGSAELADPAVGGVWNAPATWAGGVCPAAGESVTVTPSGNGTVLSLAADVATTYADLTFRVSSSLSTDASLVFDGGGYALSMPRTESPTYLNYPFRLKDGGGGDLLRLDDAALAATNKACAAPLLLDDVRFVFAQNAGGPLFRLERGHLDLCAPDGIADAGRVLYLGMNASPFRFEIVSAEATFPRFRSGTITPCHFLFDDATLRFRGAVDFGHANWADWNTGKPVLADAVLATVAATNSAFTFDGAVGFYHVGTNVFRSCTIKGTSDGGFHTAWRSFVRFEDSNVDFKGSLEIGTQGHEGLPAEVSLDGGTYSFGHLQVGYAGGSNGRLVITGGAVVGFTKSGNGSVGSVIAWRGTGVVDVVDGVLRMPDKTYCPLAIGKYSDSYGTGWGRLNVYDGGLVDVRLGSESWAGAATDGLAVGGNGHGEVHVYGGTVRAPCIQIGFLDSVIATTSFVHQTGGSVRADLDQNAGYSRLALAFRSECGGGNYDKEPAHARAAYYLDGGELCVGRIVGGKGSACQGGKGWSHFSGDGGVWRQAVPAGNYAAVTGLDRFECGDKGLTFDSNGFDVRFVQDMTNKPDAGGLFVKTGAGELSYTGACTVAALRIEGGSFRPEAGARVDSAVSVAEGAALSLEGDIASFRVASLAVTNGCLRLDPGDTVFVDGPFTSSGFSVEFSSAPEKDAVQNVLVVGASLDAGTREAVRRAFCDVVVDDGTCMSFGVADVDGETVVTLTRVDPAEPIGPENTLTWTGSGGWSSAANWRPSAVPDFTKKAVFSGEGEKAVAIDASAGAGALAFSAGGYTLAGAATLEIAAPEGAAAIEAAAGANVVAAPLRFNTIVQIPVSEGAAVSLTGPVSDGGFRKSGPGTLRLEGDNEFILTTAHGGGTLSLGSDTALGSVARPPLHFTGGVLAVSNASGQAVSVPRRIEAKAGNVPIVYETETDATLTLDQISGCVFKRGAGTLTFAFDGPAVFSSGYTCDDYHWNVAFDADGSVAASTQSTGALTVVEGRLRLAAASGFTARPSILFEKSLLVGAVYPAAAASPVLELENVDVTVKNDIVDIYLGGGMGAATVPGAPAPALVMKNASLKTYYPRLGDRTLAGVTPHVSLSDAVFKAEVQTYFGGENGASGLRVEAVDSTFDYGEALVVVCDVAADMTNTLVTGKNGAPKKLSVAYSYNGALPSKGYLRLAAGSELRVNTVKWNQHATATYAGDFRLVFEDAAWTVGDADLTLRADADPPVDPALFSVECRGAGLRLPVAAGRTFATDCRFFGSGGIEKTGEGTLAFGADAYAVTGVCRVVEGTLDLSAAGTVAGATFAGAGRIAGGRLENTRLLADGTGAPTFDATAFAGRTTVDLGRGADDPLERPYPAGIVVARFTGAVPDLSRWRLDRAGAGGARVAGVFSTDGAGNVLMSVRNAAGLSVVVR